MKKSVWDYFRSLNFKLKKHLKKGKNSWAGLDTQPTSPPPKIGGAMVEQII